MKIAVTGASGHIGINLIPVLTQSGHVVRVLSHRDESLLKNLGVSVIRGDLLDPSSLEKFIDGADAIVHLGAVVTIHQKSPEALKVNIEGTRHLLDQAIKLGVRKFIYFSSIHSLNVFPLDEVLDETREYNIKSRFDYDRSKVISEQMVLEAGRSDFRTIILNPTAVVGPADHRPSLMGKAIIRLYQGKIPALLKGGYNWVDVRDVAQATRAALINEFPERKFLLSGHWHTMEDLGRFVAEAGGKPCPNRKVPFWLARTGAGLMSAIPWMKKEDQLFTSASLYTLQNSHRNISSERANKWLGFSPRPFSQTVSDTVQWFKANNYL